MSIEVGSYEAKTKLPELLRGVKLGKSYTITSRGQPVAELVPVNFKGKEEISAAVEKMLAFTKSRKPMPDISSRSLIDEGRA